MCYDFSSPYLLVFGDDVAGGAGEAYLRRGDSLGVLHDLILKYFVNSDERLCFMFSFYGL